MPSRLSVPCGSLTAAGGGVRARHFAVISCSCPLFSAGCGWSLLAPRQSRSFASKSAPAPWALSALIRDTGSRSCSIMNPDREKWRGPSSTTPNREPGRSARPDIFIICAPRAPGTPPRAHRLVVTSEDRELGLFPRPGWARFFRSLIRILILSGISLITRGGRFPPIRRTPPKRSPAFEPIRRIRTDRWCAGSGHERRPGWTVSDERIATPCAPPRNWKICWRVGPGVCPPGAPAPAAL